MKYIITEKQYKILQEQQEILNLPGIEYFGGWNKLQSFLKRKGNPLYSIDGDLNLEGTLIKSLGNLTSVGGNLYLRGNPAFQKYSIEEIRQMVNVKGNIYK